MRGEYPSHYGTPPRNAYRFPGLPNSFSAIRPSTQSLSGKTEESYTLRASHARLGDNSRGVASLDRKGLGQTVRKRLKRDPARFRSALATARTESAQPLRMAWRQWRAPHGPEGTHEARIYSDHAEYVWRSCR